MKSYIKHIVSPCEPICRQEQHTLSPLVVLLWKCGSALHMSLKVNGVHTRDCPPISPCCTPSHRPVRGPSCSEYHTQSNIAGTLIVFVAADEDALSLGNVKARA